MTQERKSARKIAPGELFERGRIAIRPIALTDVSERYVAWLEDPEINQFLETRWSKQSLDSVREFVAGMVENESSYLFAIVRREDGVHIGNIKSGPILTHHLCADVSYFIGDRQEWGKGHATDAIRLVTRVSFERLGLHRVQAGVYETNRGSCRALEKAGYTYEGSFRKQLRSGDRWEDHLFYGALRDEWKEEGLATMRVVLIIQARMSSRRLPGKMLLPLSGKPLIQVVCERAAQTKGIDDLIVATSDAPEDAPLADAVKAAGHAVYRGSLDDVLARFLGAAKAKEADAAVRITGDCPLLDPDVIGAMVERFRKGDLAYLSNISPPTYPDGLDVEMVSVAALEAAAAETKEPFDREHVTPFVRTRPGRFASANHVKAGATAADIHWSVDEREHLELVQALFDEVAPEKGRLDDYLAVLAKRPDLDAKSRGKQRNAGSIDALIEANDREAPPLQIEKSNALWARSKGLIPAGTQTLSKGPSQFVDGFGPKYLARGKGSHVWDVDGNEFIDYPMGLGPVTLGHGHPEVVAAVSEQLANGNAFSLMHPLEIEVAEKIRQIVPCAERVRFGKNGSDATSACIRAARAKTGRSPIARCGYHGWQDWSIDAAYGIRSRGVPPEVMGLTVPFPYNDLPALEKLLASRPFAAVILEPISITPPEPGYLAGVRELATKYGAVLVFDEVITGFRYARGGAQQHFGVIPDLSSMGKGVANGMPLSLVVGKAEFMEPFEEIFFSFTFGGEAAALAAALATIRVMEREDYWAHVWRQGEKLQSGYRRLAREHRLDELTDCQGMPPWTVVVFKDCPDGTAMELKTLFQQEMLRRGILFSGSQFLSLAHSDEDIAKTIAAYDASMRVVRNALDNQAVKRFLKGKVNEVIFRRA